MGQYVLSPKSIEGYPELSQFLSSEFADSALINGLKADYAVTFLVGNQNVDYADVSPLAICACMGKIPHIQALLQHSSGIQDLQYECGRALVFAAHNNQLSSILMLLMFKEAISSLNSWGSSVLSSATRHGSGAEQLEIIRTVLSYDETGRSIQNDSHKYSALIAAAETNQIKAAEILITHPQILANVTNDHNKALCTAIYHGYTAITQLLLTQQVVRDALTTEFCNAMEMVIEHNRMTEFGLLLTCSPLVAILANKDNYLLRFAAKKGRIEMVKQLLLIPSVCVQGLLVLESIEDKKISGIAVNFIEEFLKRITANRQEHSKQLSELSQNDAALLIGVVNYMIGAHYKTRYLRELLSFSAFQSQSWSFYLLAIEKGNVAAEIILLGIESVWGKAVANDFAALSARPIATNRPDYFSHKRHKIVTPSREQRFLLSNFYKIYFPEIQRCGGVEKTLEDWEDNTVISDYEASPACITLIAMFWLAAKDKNNLEPEKSRDYFKHKICSISDLGKLYKRLFQSIPAHPQMVELNALLQDQIFTFSIRNHITSKVHSFSRVQKRELGLALLILRIRQESTVFLQQLIDDTDRKAIRDDIIRGYSYLPFKHFKKVIDVYLRDNCWLKWVDLVALEQDIPSVIHHMNSYGSDYIPVTIGKPSAFFSKDKDQQNLLQRSFGWLIKFLKKEQQEFDQASYASLNTEPLITWINQYIKQNQTEFMLFLELDSKPDDLQSLITIMTMHNGFPINSPANLLAQ